MIVADERLPPSANAERLFGLCPSPVKQFVLMEDGHHLSPMPDHWWTAMFPGLAIFLAVYGFNLLGDGLRDVFDPKARR